MPDREDAAENRFVAALDGIEKARRGIAVYAVLVLALVAVCFFFSEPALLFIVRLLGRKLVSYSPADGFVAMASIALYAGLTLSFPVGVWMVWRGVVVPRAPGLKAWGGPVILAATALFAGGVVLGYTVLLPAGIGFLVGFDSPETQALISAPKFVSFVGTMLLALGLCFEAPLLSFLFARIGWLRADFFRKHWRHAILFCTVLAAVITPTPDVYNMTLMTIPLLGLFFVSFAIVWFVEKTRHA